LADFLKASATSAATTEQKAKRSQEKKIDSPTIISGLSFTFAANSDFRVNK